MNDDEILKEIAALPPEGRSQVENFLKVIRQWYEAQGEPSPTTPLPNENFVGMWRDHDEITDSTNWIRDLRESEWR